MSAGGGSGAIDSLTSIDEKLERLIAAVRNQQTQVVQGQSQPQQTNTATTLRDTVELSISVPANTDRVEREFEMPYDGRIESVIIDMPDGADNLVGASLRGADEDRILFPEGGDAFVAFNDFGRRFQFRREAEKDSKFLAVFTSQKSVDVPVNFLVELEEAQ